MASGKTGILTIAALLIGFLGGSWLGRGSTRDLEEQLAQVRAELEAAKKQAQSAAPLAMGLQTLLRSNPQPAARPAAAEASGSSTAAPEAPAATAEPDDEAPGPRLSETAPNSEERKKMLETASATWRLRATQARAAFVQKAGLNDDQQAGLQKTVDHMNEAVKAALQQAMEHIDFEKPLERRDLVDLGVTMGGVYQDIDDELRQVLTEEQVAQLNQSDFDIFSQVDPDVVMPLLMKFEIPK
jgi:hypothetical protein